MLLTLFARNLTIFRSKCELPWKNTFSSKDFFFQNDPQRSKEAVSINSPENLSWKSEIDKMGHRKPENMTKFIPLDM